MVSDRRNAGMVEGEHMVAFDTARVTRLVVLSNSCQVVFEIRYIFVNAIVSNAAIAQLGEQ